MKSNDYLKGICDKINSLNKVESASIQTSIRMLKIHLENWKLSEEILDHHEFGSYVRGTKLPSSIDNTTDIDYMVVFDSANYRAESYIERLRRFAKKYYPNSKVHKDHPTMVIDLCHIKFEITPAVKLYGKSYPRYNIPGPQDSIVEWIDTYPEEMETDLARADKLYKNKITPLILLIKYWNITNGKPLTSYKIEHTCTHLIFNQQTTLIEYFIHAAKWLSMDQFLSCTDKVKVNQLRDTAIKIEALISAGKESLALAHLSKLLPTI